MSVLGKDLFDFQRSHTNTKVEFGASGYWVEMIPQIVAGVAAGLALLIILLIVRRNHTTLRRKNTEILYRANTSKPGQDITVPHWPYILS